MTRIGAGKCLGIAVMPHGLQIAEVVIDGGGTRRVTRVAEMPLAEELSAKSAATAGKSLAKLLREQGFSARDSVFGLPARWVVTRVRPVPPASAEVAAASLRLQAESEFSSELKELVTDYAGQASASRATNVMLVATARTHVESCTGLARAAGLKARAITVTSAAMAAGAGALNGAPRVMLSVTRGGAELMVESGEAPVMLRHMNLAEGADPAGPLASDIRRTLAGVPSLKASEVLLADPAGLLSGAALQQRLQIPIRAHALKVHAEKQAALTHAQAVSLGLLGLERGNPSVDFLNSRLAPKHSGLSRRKMALAAVIPLALVLLVVLAFWDLRNDQAHLANLRAKVDSMAGDVAKAELAETRLKFVRNWSPGRERFAACLVDLTRLFPDEGVIWASGISIRADLGGQFSGKATSERHVLTLLDKLQGSPQFADAKLLDMREGGSAREVAFSISFTYRPRETK